MAEPVHLVERPHLAAIYHAQAALAVLVVQEQPQTVLQLFQERKD